MTRQSQGTITAAFILACGGWLGIFFLVRNILPQAGARWLFFVLLYIAVAGSVIPLSHFLNTRFRGDRPPPPDWVSVRQGIWVGLYVTTCVWLQIPRVLNPTLAFFLALSLLVIELFLRLRERNQQGF